MKEINNKGVMLNKRIHKNYTFSYVLYVQLTFCIHETD